jgi:hypothetical protein
MHTDHPEWTEHWDENRKQTPAKVFMERHAALSQVEDCQQGHPQHTYTQEHPYYSRRDEHIIIVPDIFLERKFLIFLPLREGSGFRVRCRIYSPALGWGWLDRSNR